ncbi:MAG: bfpB [Gammaproteobacteria bacterium]|jgi:type IVB pilus formation R64 PilN family outer membrane protein|nr:bfpB [Gammaproteobacteria bacterium]
MFCRRIILLLLTMLVISSCNSPVYNQAEGNVADVKQRIDEARQRSNESGKSSPPLVVNEGPYVDKTPISLAKQPTWLRNHIVLKGDQLPFSFYSRTIVGGAGHNVLTHYQVGLDESQKVSINYSGTVRGALDLLAAKSGYVYSVNGNSVYWQAFVTKTFDIAFMPGSSDYMMGKASGGSGISNVASGGSASTNTTVTAIIDDSASSQYSNLKGTLSIWKDLEKTIGQLLSPQGTVMVSESTTSVTVRDRPTNIDLIGKYIANLNNNLSKQVLVKVQVLDVTLNNAFNYGINWQAVKTSLGQQFQLNANYGTPISLSTLNPFSTTTPLSGTGGPGLPQIGTVNINNSSTGVTALINALTQQGKVSLVTEPRVVCLNNQVSVIRIVNQEGYLASVQTTSLSGSGTGGASITTQVTPGTVVTGLTLYILPKILGSKVFLQVNADLSTNNGIQTLSSTTGTTPSSNNSVPVIQVPSVTQKQFNQRSVVATGDTLILSGFRQVNNQANAMQLFQSQQLGGKGAFEETVETIVLITPIILHGFS